jgi:quercetin dioxygenase-like cupin family protein
MDTRSLTELLRFSEDHAQTGVLTETTNLWSQVICVQGAQGVGPMSDPSAEGLLIVLAGEVAVQVGRSRTRMAQWETTTIPAGEDLTIRNASPDPGVVLLVLSPPPSPVADAGSGEPGEG